VKILQKVLGEGATFLTHTVLHRDLPNVRIDYVTLAYQAISKCR